MTRLGKNAPQDEPGKAAVRRAVALLAPAVARHRKAFDEINFALQGEGRGGVGTSGAWKLEINIGDILAEENFAEMSQHPEIAEARIREEAIHSLVRQEITDEEAAEI